MTTRSLIHTTCYNSIVYSHRPSELTGQTDGPGRLSLTDSSEMKKADMCIWTSVHSVINMLTKSHPGKTTILNTLAYGCGRVLGCATTKKKTLLWQLLLLYQLTSSPINVTDRLWMIYLLVVNSIIRIGHVRLSIVCKYNSTNIVLLSKLLCKSK